MDKSEFESQNVSIVKMSLTSLDYQDSNAVLELIVVQSDIPQKFETFRLRPWRKKSNLQLPTFEFVYRDQSELMASFGIFGLSEV